MMESFMQDSEKRVRFNTGTMLDLATGKFEQGAGGKFYLNGGLGTCTTGLHGRGNMYKSTLMDSWIMGSMRLNPDMQAIIVDTEYSKEKDRTTSMMQTPRHGYLDISDRVSLKSDPEWTTEFCLNELNKMTVYLDTIKKDRILRTPFLNKAGEPIQVLKPIVLFYDSWSELSSAAIQEFLKDKGLDDAKFRTLYMENANRKTLFMTLLNQWAKKYGLVVCATARTGENSSMTHMPPAKELTHQRQKDKIKDVGSKFTTLVHVLTQVLSCTNLQDSTKEPEYPLGATGDLDLQLLEVNSSRNKSNMSGPSIPYVVSQQYGLLNDVSNFHYLRTYQGCNIGTGRPNFSCPWLPEVSFQRKKLREVVFENYPLSRALELVAQYRYIQQCWNTSNLGFDFAKPAEAVFDQLVSSSVVMKDVLETTGAWAPLPSNWKPNGKIAPKGADDREYMSLFDILHLVK